MPAETITPFHADVPQADLDDLQQRLAHVRWPDALPDVGWAYGVPLDYARELVAYWRGDFDWRAQEKRLNQHPQFVTQIDGQRVHFLHVRSPEPNALPLLCSHGWPMSVFEYLDLIGPLTDPGAHGGHPADAFDLVVPSLPGVGFSGPTSEPGWDTRWIARAWARLMAQLGYERYGAHGNDAGSQISPEVGRWRYYADTHATEPPPTEPTSAPTGVAIFASDFQTIRRFADRDHSNIVRWTRYDRGSHFSPHDAPDLLLEDIRAFYRDLR